MKGLFSHIVKRSLRVPAPAAEQGNGEVITRQLDVALLSVGFKLSQEALRYFSTLHPAIVKALAADVLSAVRELVGDHCQHNTYFKDFPTGVPDTMEFWLQRITDALFDPNSRDTVAIQLSFGVVNLLDLPKYGKYQHSYEEMLAAHEQFIPSAKDRLRILNLGKSLPEEAVELYHSLAGSSVPLNESDRELLAQLAEVCLHDPQPNSIPVRENLAVINAVRMNNERAPIVDTPIDILRLACALSGGDVTLEKPTKFKSLGRKVRLGLMVALNSIIESQPAKLADVNQYRGQWKRLGELLHPHEYRRLKHAQDAFAVARGEKRAHSLAGKIEMAFAAGDAQEAIRLLATAPGMLFRYLDRILRTDSGQQAATLLEILPTVISKVSGRVILSVREHLQNRLEKGETEREPASRIFANSKGKAWVKPDVRPPLPGDLVGKLFGIFDAEVLRRLPEIERLLVNSEAFGLAVPLSDKSKSEGFGVMPRGSVLPVAKGTLRFFVYWKEKSIRTDYDLSALMLDETFQQVGQLSYSNLRHGHDVAVHSGDITSAAAGASEFIDIDLNAANCTYIIPQINVFAGERFDEVQECFMGFMERAPEQKGKPFEAATVRMKSVIRGNGMVALPLVFMRGNDGGWSVKWMNIFLNGLPQCNRVEATRMSTTLLARSIVKRRYLDLTYLAVLLTSKAKNVSWYTGQEMTEPVTYLGLDAPEGLPKGSVTITLSNLQDLIPG